MNVSESAEGYQLQRAQAVIPKTTAKPCGHNFFLPGAGAFTSFQGFLSRAASRSLAGDCTAIGATTSCSTICCSTFGSTIRLTFTWPAPSAPFQRADLHPAQNVGRGKPSILRHCPGIHVYPQSEHRHASVCTIGIFSPSISLYY